MRNAISLFAVQLCFCAAVHADNVENKIKTDKNGYTATSSKELTDSTGATVKDDTKKTVTNKDSERETTTSHTSSRDPEGLGNKAWTKGDASQTNKIDGSVDKSAHTKSVDEAGTGRSVSREEEKSVNPDGSTTTVVKEKKEVDPKGLGNKNEVDSEVTTRRNPDGSIRDVQGEISHTK